MDGRPAEDRFYDALLGKNIDPFAGSNHVVGATVALQVEVAIFGDVAHEPRNLIGMGLDHHFVAGLGVDHPYRSAVGIGEGGIDKRLDVVKPKLLPGAFETGRRGVVEVGMQKTMGVLGEQAFCLRSFGLFGHRG